MSRGWPLLFPLAGVVWWLLGFPPSWGWLVAPMFPDMPVSLGMLVSLVVVVAGLALTLRLVLDNS